MMHQISNGGDIDIPSSNPKHINWQELMDYYGYKGRIGSFRLKLKLARNKLLQLLAELSPTPGLTVKFQRMKGVKIGKNVYIGPQTFLDTLYPHLITIEDYVSMGYCLIFVHSNPTYSYLIKEKIYPRMVKPVTIKRGAWISAGCMILPGVTIGEHSIIGARSLVNKDVPPKTLAAGSPAKIVKELDFGDSKCDDNERK